MKHLCRTCGASLRVGENWSTAQAEKRNYKCSGCRAEYQKEYHRQNRDRQNAKSRQRYAKNRDKYLEKQKYYVIGRQYGLSKEEYHKLIDGASCKICGKDSDLVVDHCHNSGHVRGVLCRQCNCALGLFGDNVNKLQAAVEYLNDN